MEMLNISRIDYRFDVNMLIEVISQTYLRTVDIINATSKEVERLTYDYLCCRSVQAAQRYYFGFYSSIKTIFSYDLQYHFVASPYLMPVDLNVLSLSSRIVVSSKHGILLCESAHPKSVVMIIYVVCKFATRPFRVILNPRTRFYTFKFVIVLVGGNPFHYRMFRLSYRKKQ